MCMDAKRYGCCCVLKVLLPATCCMLTFRQLKIDNVFAWPVLDIPNVHQMRVVWHPHVPTLCDFARSVMDWTFLM